MVFLALGLTLYFFFCGEARFLFLRDKLFFDRFAVCLIKTRSGGTNSLAVRPVLAIRSEYAVPPPE